jgi:hypothetical protein
LGQANPVTSVLLAMARSVLFLTVNLDLWYFRWVTRKAEVEGSDQRRQEDDSDKVNA